MSEKTGVHQVRRESTDEQDMAQIRELLFGEHSRQTSRRLEEIAARLNAQEQALRALVAQTDERVTLIDSELQESNTSLRHAIDALAQDLERMQQGSVNRIHFAELLETMARQLRQSPD